MTFHPTHLHRSVDPIPHPLPDEPNLHRRPAFDGFRERSCINHEMVRIVHDVQDSAVVVSILRNVRRNVLGDGPDDGVLLVAGAIGYVAGSWTVFAIVAVVLIGLSVHAGGIRPRSRRR